MRYKEFRLLLAEMAADAVDNWKEKIASQIKVLPADDATIKTLREIEDLLRDVNAGGRKGLIAKDLQSINDPAVNAVQKDLTRYILSIDGTPEERNQLFSLWKQDQIVNKDALFSGQSVSFEEVFNTYGSNPITTELVDTLMNVATLGHGKGEFALNVFSKTINKPSDGKGDLKADWKGRTWQVEVKTASMTTSVDPETGKEKSSKASARFGDQEVRPIEGWDPAARDLNDFVRGTGPYKNRKGFKLSLTKSGLSLTQAIEFHQNVTGEIQSTFMQKLKSVVEKIFGNAQTERKEYTARLKRNIKEILLTIQDGDIGAAKQAYAQASFNNYMALKHDDGVLFVNLYDKNLIWYNSAEDLISQGLRFHADSIYLTGVNDPGRTAYPQIYVQPTTFGGEASTKELGKFAKKPKDVQNKDFVVKLISWGKKLAKMRNITSEKIVNKIIDATMELIIVEKVPTKDIIDELEKRIPQLKPNITKGQSTRIPGSVTSNQSIAPQPVAQQPISTTQPQGAV